MTEYEKMDNFASEHALAGRFLMVATEDYSASRCLSQNLLITSLVVGAQAIEKFLKAYLLMADPGRNARKFHHSLATLLEEVHGIAPHLSLLRFTSLIERFNGYYRARYPDNPDQPKSMTSADMIELDELILILSDTLPCPRTVRYRTGLFAAATFSLTHQGQISPIEHWLKVNNRALLPRMPEIEREQIAVLQQIHPEWQP